MLIWQKELRILVYFLIGFILIAGLVSTYFTIKTNRYLETAFVNEFNAEVEIVKFSLEKGVPIVELPATPLISSITRLQKEPVDGSVIINNSGIKYQIVPNKKYLNRMKLTTRLYLFFIIVICISVLSLDYYVARRVLIRKADSIIANDRSQSLTQFVNEAIRKIRQKEETVNNMATMVSHELRNSLSTILGLGRASKIDQKRLLIEINSMLDLLDRISLFAKPIKVKKDLISLNDLISDAIGNFNNVPGVKISFYSEDEFKVETDPIVVDHILSNIIKNSIESFTNSGNIDIRLEKQQETAMIKIVDDGPGISRSIIDRIYLPFFSTKPDGTGLGLAIVKRFAEAIDAEVDIDSTPGRGTTVKIVLRYA